MFTIIGLMLTGMLLGFLLRKQKLSGIHKVITVLIWLLLFLLGIDVGGNQKIINGLHAIGLEAQFRHHLGSSAGQCYSSMGFMVCTLQKK